MSRNLVCVLFVSLGWYSCDGWAQSGLVLPDLASNLGATDVSTGGTVLAGGTSPLGEEPDKLIDDLVSTKWLAFEPSGTIVDVQLPSGPRIVNAYTVTSANDFPLRDPYDLVFSGSNDGANFTQIEFFIDIEFESRFETQLFMSGNASSYEYYRFDFFTEFGALGDPDTMSNSIQVAEIELLENFVLDLPKLVVNRDTGDMTLENPSLAPLDLAGYSVTSPFGGDGIPNASAIAGGNSPIGEEPEMGIDNSTNTKWLTFEPNGTFYQVAFDGGAKHAVNTYTISSANDFPERDPLSWTLSGSNDGVNFTVVDAQQSQGFANRFETQRFRVGNSQFYNSYRFDFQTALGAGAPDPGDPNSIQISEIELFDDPNAAILTLKLDATTGNAVLQNESPFAIELDSYRIFSVSGALDPSGWSTIQSQDLPGFPPGSGVGDGWEAGPNPNNFELIEWFLTDSSSLGASQSIDLGSAFSYNGNTDILFEFHNDLQGEVRGYVEYLNVPTGPVCDVTADQACDNDDIDVLYDEIAAGSNPAFVDFDGNGMVDVDDIDDWLTLAGIENGKVYLPGDTNLDGEVGGPDFTRLALNFGNVGSNPALAAAYWGDGNFNADAGIGIFEVGGVDFTALALNFGFASVASVPEPDSVSLAWLAITLWFARTSQRRTVLRLVALTPLCGRLE